MKFIKGKDRNQTEIFCLNQIIDEANELRLIDLFVGSLSLSEFGFKTKFIENGRPAYHPSDLLRLRNLEVLWLMRGLVPDHNTISNFRKDNPKAIQKVFRATVQLAKHFDLIGGKLIAGDSTKLRAQNSKKNNFNEKKKVTNKNDSKAMGEMVRRAKTILGTSDFTALYDKGYHTGTEFDYTHKHGVEVMVAFPDVASHAPDISFDVEQFDYNKENDQYTCPAGENLKTNGRWYNKASGKTINRVKHYKTKACLTCTLFERCTRNKSGRFIERS
jgi:transposase